MKKEYSIGEKRIKTELVERGFKHSTGRKWIQTELVERGFTSRHLNSYIYIRIEMKVRMLYHH